MFGLVVGGSCQSGACQDGKCVATEQIVPTSTPRPSPTPTLGVLALPVGPTTIPSYPPPSQFTAGTLTYGTGTTSYSPYIQTGLDNPLSGGGSCTPADRLNNNCVIDPYTAGVLGSIGLSSAVGLAMAGYTLGPGALVTAQSYAYAYGTTAVATLAAGSGAAAKAINYVQSPSGQQLINQIQTTAGVVGLKMTYDACQKDYSSSDCAAGLTGFSNGGLPALVDSSLGSGYSNAVKTAGGTQIFGNIDELQAAIENSPVLPIDKGVGITAGGKSSAIVYFGTNGMVTKDFNSSTLSPPDLQQIVTQSQLRGVEGVPQLGTVFKTQSGTVAYTMSTVPGETATNFYKSGGKLTLEEINQGISRLQKIQQVTNQAHGDLAYVVSETGTEATYYINTDNIMVFTNVQGGHELGFVDLGTGNPNLIVKPSYQLFELNTVKEGLINEFLAPQDIPVLNLISAGR